MEMIRISLITATLNSGRTLANTLATVTKENCVFEHVFVDGGSSDNTISILKEYISENSNARLVCQTGKGLYGALNDGVRNAKGDYVFFLHSDDTLASSGVVDRYEEIARQRRPDLVYADAEFANADGIVCRIWKSGKYSRRKCLLGWMPPHVTCLTRRGLFEEIGFFEERGTTAADYEWLLRVLWDDRHSVAYLPEVTVNMRVGGASSASIRSRIRANIADGQSWRKRIGVLFFIPQIAKPMRKLLQFRLLYRKGRKAASR